MFYFDSLNENTENEFIRSDSVNQRLIHAFENQGNLFIIGGTAAGKTSYVKAFLKKQVNHKTNDYIYIQLNNNPFNDLSDSIVDYYLSDDDTKTRELSYSLTRTFLRENKKGISESIDKQGLGEGKNKIVIVDQFEQVFSKRVNETERKNFFQLLEHTINANDNIKLIVLMNSEFVTNLLKYNVLSNLLFSCQFILPCLDLNEINYILGKKFNSSHDAAFTKRIETLAPLIAGFSAPLVALRNMDKKTILDPNYNVSLFETEIQNEFDKLNEEERSFYENLFSLTFEFSIDGKLLKNSVLKSDFLSYTGLDNQSYEKIKNQTQLIFNSFFEEKKNEILIKSLIVFRFSNFIQGILEKETRKVVLSQIAVSELLNKTQKRENETSKFEISKKWLKNRGFNLFSAQMERKSIDLVLSISEKNIKYNLKKLSYFIIALLILVVTFLVFRLSENKGKAKLASVNEQRAKEQLNKSYQYKRFAEVMLYNTLELQRNNLSLIKSEYKDSPTNELVHNKLLQSYDDIAWFMILNKDYENATKISKEALSVDSTAYWLNINLIISQSLSNQLNQSKATYMFIKDKKPTKKEYQNSNFKEIVMGVLMGLEQDGVSHSNIDSLINYVMIN